MRPFFVLETEMRFSSSEKSRCVILRPRNRDVFFHRREVELCFFLLRYEYVAARDSRLHEIAIRPIPVRVDQLARVSRLTFQQPQLVPWRTCQPLQLTNSESEPIHNIIHIKNVIVSVPPRAILRKINIRNNIRIRIIKRVVRDITTFKLFPETIFPFH